MQGELMIEGMAVIFGDRDRTELTAGECISIAYSHDYVLTAPGIPSFNELLSSGRLEIIRDQRLSGKLSAFQQSLDVLGYWRSWGTRELHTLPDKHPMLIKLEAYYDDERAEVWARATCDTNGMRENQQFLNNLSENADTFDGFVRDALEPWNNQLSELHDQLDFTLDISHGDTNQ